MDIGRSYKAIGTRWDQESRDEILIRTDSVRSVEWPAQHSDSDKYHTATIKVKLDGCTSLNVKSML